MLNSRDIESKIKHESSLPTSTQPPLQSFDTYKKRKKTGVSFYTPSEVHESAIKTDCETNCRSRKATPFKKFRKGST